MGISILDDASVPGPRSATGIIALITVVSYLLSAFQAAIDEKYPKKEQPEIFRKYAPVWLTLENLITQSIRESRDPAHSYGESVVYLAKHDIDDAILRTNYLSNLPVACPPSSNQATAISEAYQLPYANAVKYEAALAESYLDIEVTRENILISSERTNGNDITEVIVSAPLAWVPGKPNTYRYLLFGPMIIGVGFYQVCF